LVKAQGEGKKCSTRKSNQTSRRLRQNIHGLETSNPKLDTRAWGDKSGSYSNGEKGGGQIIKVFWGGGFARASDRKKIHRQKKGGAWGNLLTRRCWEKRLKPTPGRKKNESVITMLHGEKKDK